MASCSEINTEGTEPKILHAFAENRMEPIQGSLTLYGNRLYGMTTNGGTAGFGTVFSINVKGCDYQTLYSFKGPTPTGSTAWTMCSFPTESFTA